MAPSWIEVRLYATARQAARQSSVRIEAPPAGLAAAELVRTLARRFPALAPVLRVSRFVRNDRTLPHLRARVRPGDRFSVHPPYGGG